MSQLFNSLTIGFARKSTFFSDSSLSDNTFSIHSCCMNFHNNCQDNEIEKLNLKERLEEKKLRTDRDKDFQYYIPQPTHILQTPHARRGSQKKTRFQLALSQLLHLRSRERVKLAHLRRFVDVVTHTHTHIQINESSSSRKRASRPFFSSSSSSRFRTFALGTERKKTCRAIK